MKNSYSLLCTIFLTALALSISNANSTEIRQDIVSDWCVAKANAPDDKLKQFVEEACKGASRSSLLDCTIISPGGACFEPNTLRDHASYLLNIYYKSRGLCNPNLGVILNSNPSTGSCNYP